MSGRMIMAMNIHREICGAVLDGGVSLESHQVKFVVLQEAPKNILMFVDIFMLS